MITLRIPPWIENTGLDHLYTTWQISDTIDFINILDESVRDSVFVDVFYSNVVVPIGEEYYARSKRHFSNGGETDWDGPIKLLPSEAGDTLDIKPETVIEEPSIKIEIDEINNEYVLKAGSFRCNSDGHLATNWILKNGLGNVLFRSIDDKLNLKSIKIKRDDLNIGNSNHLVAEVSFISTNEFQSPFGSYKMGLNKFSFEVMSNTNFIPIHEDYEFKFKSLKKDDEYNLTKYVVRNQSDEIIQEAVFDVNDERIIIERELLRSKSTYYIDFYQSDLPNDIKTITFYTNRNSSIYKTDHRFKYLEEYEDLGIMVDELKQITSEQFKDNGIPMTTGSDKEIKLYNYDRRFETVTVSDLAMSFIKRPILNNKGANLTILDSDRFMIDSQTSPNGDMEFKVYDYNYHELLTSEVRTDEYVTNALTNNIVVDNEQMVYYFASTSNGNKFRSFNPETGEIKDLKVRPDLASMDANLAYIGNDLLMSFNGSVDNNLAYIYDISTDTWLDVTVVPEKFRDLTMQTFLRKDGKVASFNTGNDTNDVLVFDPKDYTFETKINNLDDTIDLDSTVRLRNGEFLRYDSRQASPKLYLYR